VPRVRARVRARVSPRVRASVRARVRASVRARVRASVRARVRFHLICRLGGGHELSSVYRGGLQVFKYSSRLRLKEHTDS